MLHFYSVIIIVYDLNLFSDSCYFATPITPHATREPALPVG
jgi:hypothetical protein